MKKTVFNPFLYYSEQLQNLLHQAAKQKDAAWWLYKHDARTVFFMLEALTRLHQKAFDEKVFDKWNKRFKKLEDLFGEVDEYAALETQFKANKKIPREVIRYFTVRKESALEKCNRRLLAKDWLKDKLEAFDRKISAFDQAFDEAYLAELRFALEKEIDAILYFALRVNYQFTKIEDEVHELRRKLRWLSIYAQALRGLIQLKKSASRSTYAQQYFTRDILNSPFNKLPPKPAKAAVMEFDVNSFYALSWAIRQLGTWKDSILNLHQLRDAIYVTGHGNKAEAGKQALEFLGMKASAESDVLREASEMLRVFITHDKILDTLIVEH